MAQSMHSGYNKNENDEIKAEQGGDQSKVLVGNWAEERALKEVRWQRRAAAGTAQTPGKARTQLVASLCAFSASHSHFKLGGPLVHDSLPSITWFPAHFS